MTGMPPWAEASEARRAHVERVATLIASWADALGVAAAERERWVRAAYLHDALRDSPATDRLIHGPLAADRAAAHGESDQGVLDAVRYHTVGFAGWDDVGRMLYLADFLEPGRTRSAVERAGLAQRVPTARDAVLAAVARWRIGMILRAGWPLPRETVDFWNSIARP